MDPKMYDAVMQAYETLEGAAELLVALAQQDCPSGSALRLVAAQLSCASQELEGMIED